MPLQSILHLETKTPLMIWPSAAAGISTSPRGKQDKEQLHKMQDIIVKQLRVKFMPRKKSKQLPAK